MGTGGLAPGWGQGLGRLCHQGGEARADRHTQGALADWPPECVQVWERCPFLWFPQSPGP